jgi:GNAT superfamily N-acetyltransferase
MSLRIETSLIDEHTTYIDWTGELQQGGRVSPDASYAVAVNCYDDEQLIGSLVYERYPNRSAFGIDSFPGPYFHMGGDEVAMLHTIWVDPACRGQGILYLLLAPLVEAWLPVYTNRWQNAELGVFFEQRFRPDDRFASETFTV